MKVAARIIVLVLLLLGAIFPGREEEGVFKVAAGPIRRFPKVDIPDPVDEQGHGLHRQHDGADTSTYLKRRKGHFGHDPIGIIEYYEVKEKEAAEKKQKALDAAQPSTYDYEDSLNEKGEVVEPVVPVDHVHKPWPNLKGTTKAQRVALRNDLHAAGRDRKKHAEVFKKHGFETPGHIPNDPGKCYSVAGKYCKGLTYDHANFLACAVKHKEKFVGDDEHCQWEISDLWATCASDLVRHCSRLNADETFKCFLSIEESQLSPDCVESDMMDVLQRTDLDSQDDGTPIPTNDEPVDLSAQEL